MDASLLALAKSIYTTATHEITRTTSQEQLLELRRYSTIYCVNSDLLSAVKENQFFWFRGKRGGKRKVATKIFLREHTNNSCFNMDCSRRSRGNLILVPRSPLPVNTVFSKDFDFFLLNTRSVKNKSFIVKDFVIDFLAITKTWLRVHMIDQRAVNCLCPTGNNFLHLPPTKCRGGGVAVLYRKCFSLIKKLSIGVSFKSCEFTADCMINYSRLEVSSIVGKQAQCNAIHGEICDISRNVGWY